ncbi:MAG: hypothetical protein ABS911_03675 [Carnobacterium sp.]|uniref:hypothetical protein n=1 Tax=Carnobacterium sp. TaxID=48221 RepID=UPI003314C5B6
MGKFTLFMNILSLIAIPILLIRALVFFIKDPNNKYKWINPLSYSLFFFYLLLLYFDSDWLFYAGWLSMVFSFFLDHIADTFKEGINVFDSTDISKKKTKLYQITLYSFPIVILFLISLYFIFPQNY